MNNPETGKPKRTAKRPRATRGFGMRQEVFHRKASKASLGLGCVDRRRRASTRILVVGFCFLLAFGLVFVRALHLHVVRAEELSARARNEYTRIRTAMARRGVIYDARYRELAITLDVTSIAARPEKVENVASASIRLARSLDLEETDVLETLMSGDNFVWIKRLAKPGEVKRVRELGLPGVAFVPENRRFYPQRELAAQVIGLCGVDGRGIEGLEHRFNDILAGEKSQYTILRNAWGESLTSAGELGTPVGRNLVLTLDLTIQYIAESALAEAAEKYKAKGGMAVVMCPSSGSVLAMAQYPSVNFNAYGKYPREYWRNRVVTDPVEPGSTLKVFLAAAALETGLLTPESRFNCENGAYRVGVETVKDEHPHGVLTLAEIVKYSSNIGAIKVGEVVGKKALHETLTAFGFGRKLGIECPGESRGILSNYVTWRPIEAGTIAFGQGVAVSALQLASALSAIANGGTLMKPYLVQAITDADGRLVESFSPTPLNRVISQSTAASLKLMMADVVEEGGTGTLAALEGYTVCGKTGTAQKASPTGGYARGKYTAAFIGFAPADDPKIVVVVLVDEPRGQHYGGVVAGPAFKKIAERTLQYMNVLPESGTSNLTAATGGDRKT
ncbi:MAG: penicillin-binding protein 2 [Proteobacteria bacterium]|nr:penicillin-binding protein 2 [Pseudomonadota bacterium]